MFSLMEYTSRVQEQNLGPANQLMVVVSKAQAARTATTFKRLCADGRYLATSFRRGDYNQDNGLEAQGTRLA